MAKKVAKKTAKKASPPAKKKVSKKPAKKAIANKTAKPSKKISAKKKTAKKVSKPAKKTIASKSSIKNKKKSVVAKAPAKKETKKIVQKIVKPTKLISEKKDMTKKNNIPVSGAGKSPTLTSVKKQSVKPMKKPVREESSIDMDDDSTTSKREDVLYAPSKQPAVHKPNKLNPIIPKPQINTDKRTRYSDSELQEFKELIFRKLDEAKKDYELLKSTLSHKDDHGTDDTSPTFKLLEDGSDVMSKEETAHLAARQEKFIKNLQNALIRIENKTYGICRATGKLISKERLRSVPHATLSIDAKLEQASS